MSAILGSYTYEMDASYAADFSRDREPVKTRSRHPEYRRKGSAPTRVNGMHRRRNKRWSWGSGRGARMANLRAFASCVAVAIAALASHAIAAPITFDWATIGNPGNPNNVVSGTNFGGQVNKEFRISKTETTNAEYVRFLNAVDEQGTNTLGLYNTSSATSSLYGITLTATAAVGNRYAVKAGAPSGAPAGTNYGNMPVNFTSWFSAARYVNWIANGFQSGTAGAASIANGSYNVGVATSGPIPARSANAQYWLPSQDEWYKAAFFRPTAVSGTAGVYTRYQTNSNVVPVATGTFTTPNAANYANVPLNTSPNPIQVGAYVNSTSAYGVYDMLGNVVEMTDTANPANAAQFRALGGGYGGLLSSWDGQAAAIYQMGTMRNITYGFRVATVPVPEPETITLAAFGIVGLCGANWMRRKRKVAARPDAECEALAA